MADMDEHDRKIVSEFCHLLEKSKQLFNGLRDLPQYGHKQWQAYFGRTFDIYTKLWKFQQQHRQILDSKYGLKRWQIGEIASKIGQLYYHYYLRTSETNYLNEAFSFYAAIRGRAYYSRTSKDDRGSDLMVKKLRYYARFIVVCLLLKRMKLVRDLVRELSQQIEEYASTYSPDDQLEWTLVLGEIRSFIDADNAINVLDMDSNTIVLSHRLSTHNTPPLDKTPPVSLSLQEILIVGNCNDQVKFSELTIDMFRMLQTLEREPLEDLAQVFDNSPATGKNPYNGETGSRVNKRENPHKYLLYKPTFSQLLVFLASGFKELPANGVMLLYISADGTFATGKQSQDPGYDYGGVITNSKRDTEHHNHHHNNHQNSLATQNNKRGEGIQMRDLHCFYPGDLSAFTRKPMFVIVDSDNSNVFANMKPMFGQPLVVLMSPRVYPHQFQEEHQCGNLFTLFLHCPLMGLCFVSSVCDVPMLLWERCQTLIDRFIAEAAKLITRTRHLDNTYIQFFSDDFLRLIILRYIFCSTVLRAHRAFKVSVHRRVRMTHQNGITNQTSNTAQSSSFLSTFWQPKQETNTTEVITTTEEVESVSFTWSPVPPRRATNRAAQSLCLTLYCDDSLDDITQNIKLPSSTKNTPAKKKTLRDVLNSPSDLESEDLGSASVFSIFDPYIPTNKPMNLRSRAAYLLNAGTPELGKSPAVAFDSFSNVNAIAKATASLAGQHFDSKSAMPSKVNVSEDDGFPFPEETERDCVSPLHISHTPYSPIPSCSRDSNRATSRKDAFKASSNVDGSSSTTANDEMLGARVKTKRQSKRQSTRERRSRSQFNSPYGMYLASLETRKTDASLTAHLPPWHSIGNISLSYKKSASQENLQRRRCVPSASSTTDTFDTEESRVTFNPNVHSFLQSSSVEATQLGSKPLDLPLKTTDGSYSMFKKEEGTTATNSLAKTPVSPSDSILSTGFQLGSVTASQLKPSTHPQDTPTHSPTKQACPGVTRRTQPSTDTQDLRLDSIHDLSWLNKMEPEEQTLLEVHVIWSILSLMVVLLACYSLHQPFNR